MPQVSIIIAVLNGEQTIRHAIESAQRQTIGDLEIVVVNDGSSDNTHGIVATMSAADPRIKYVHLPKNLGVGGARNAALEVATGEWVTVLDADDWYEPNRLEVMLKAAQDLKADIIADNLKIYDHILGQVVCETHHGRSNHPSELTAEIFFKHDNPLRRHPMGFLQPLMRRQFIVDHKIAYDPTHRVGEDFIFVSEMLLLGAKAFIIPQSYYIYVHRISPTTRKVSPHSHSKVTAVFALMARGCDELMNKYGNRMNAATRHALLQRRWILENAIEYKNMRRALDDGRTFAAMKIVLRHPIILVLVGNIITGLIIANIRAGLHGKNVGRSSNV